MPLLGVPSGVFSVDVRAIWSYINIGRIFHL